MDVVLAVERMPRPGETVLSTATRRAPGGKGLNQAVACARAGAPTQFLGALGSDAFGAELASELDASGIQADLVRRTPGESGQALIVVDSSAENMIVVASGANAEFSGLNQDEMTAVSAAKVLLMQLELSVTAVTQAARAGKDGGAVVMLNAAPAAILPAELLECVQILVVNEHEACVLSGLDDIDEASRSLAATVHTLIVTLGADGSVVYRQGQREQSVAAIPVTPLDTTGAGDTFCGALAAGIAEGQPIIDAVRFATAAAALSVQSLGAVPSIPWRSDIERLAKEQS